ncbi:MAG TPA: glucose-6-phosphate dehydrogenase assembly protein OpcA [Chthoniobacterales bacterium]
MDATAQNFSIGMPVAIGSIERELKKLWAEGDERMTRASLINLAVYSERADSLQSNTQILSQLTEDHACRAIVIALDPSASEDRIEAWIAAHCHVSREGTKQVCSEQISFSLSGSLRRLLLNIVFSHLDSDLPFYLWWQGELHEVLNRQLWSWIDRLIYDSAEWSKIDAQLRLIETAQADAKQRLVLADLNWMRLVHVRLAVAQFFDSPAAQEQLANLQRVEITHAPAYRSTAMLLAGWLAAQLGWMLIEAADENTLGFSDCAGETIRVIFDEADGEPISRCSLLSNDAEFRVTQESGADLLEATTHFGGEERMHQLMPAGRNEPGALLSEDLMRGGRREVYLRALEVVRELL